MIEGLKFDIDADEMDSHLKAREKHHTDRVLFYADKAGALQAGGAEAMNYTNGDPVRALKDRETEHRHKIALFNFLRRHIVAGETYRLTESELVKLEFIESKGWY